MSSQRSRSPPSRGPSQDNPPEIRGPSSQAARDTPASSQQYASWTNAERRRYLIEVTQRQAQEAYNQVNRLTDDLYYVSRERDQLEEILERALPREEYLAAVGRFDEIEEQPLDPIHSSESSQSRSSQGVENGRALNGGQQNGYQNGHPNGHQHGSDNSE